MPWGGSGRLLVLALGETDDIAASIVRERFPAAAALWLERSRVRSAPIQTLRQMLSGRPSDALLVVPDLRAPRFHLVALLAGLPAARRRWVADATGRFEPFSFSSHLRGHLSALLSHGLATLLALALGRPLLAALGWVVAHGRGRDGPGEPRRRDGLRRILYLRSQFWFGLRGGGSVAHTAGVIGGLQARGVDVAVVSSDRLAGVDAAVLVVPPERWFDGSLKEAEEIAYNGPFLAAAWRVARAVRPDALYQRYTAFNVSGVLLSRLLRIPLVLELNSSDVWKGEHWGELHRLDLARIAERVNLDAAHLVVVVSRVLRDDLVAAGVPPRKVLVNPNGVDPERFRPDVPSAEIRQRYALGDRVVVGFSGTFGVWHGIPALAGALPRVTRARPEVRFLLVGDGPLRPLVDEAVAAHDLQGCVCLPGLVPHAEMPGYLAACDVLVSPHGRQVDGGEFFGSPTKLYEYMAAGRAIVASDLGQIGEVLEHGRTALLVPPDDAEALADAIIHLVDDPALRQRLGTAARARAVEAHTWRRNAARVLDALEAGRHGA